MAERMSLSKARTFASLVLGRNFRVVTQRQLLTVCLSQKSSSRISRTKVNFS